MYHSADSYTELREQQRANECKRAAGDIAIQAMRAKLGKNSIASHFDKLSKAQKKLLLHYAGINADLLWEHQFSEFDRKQRNEIRHAIIEVTNLAHIFDKVSLCKDQCHFQQSISSKPKFRISSG
ncbi:hypothetical protein D5R81_07640 [Parashewanella spongiae]|uniref:Uncharacterized protein n=1 Tax=Parashewanella spongiae TaxID=342950 RepID=A0A3A6UFN2_9GAMM|nr:hypothetical protein [Parashewanella spongiae]MCL1077116.1 hypothetical protein [Parashewanella spongiae]RJY17651.1 hypothetical protein D5R81_07640 [Parashewanella spongiae]